MKEFKQKTLKKEIVLSGRGLFSGKDTVLKLIPAPVNKGIVFKRLDVDKNIEIPASLEYVSEALRCTQITNQGISVQTTEHLLAAVAAAEIDNLLIEIKGQEVPIFDGSSLVFCNKIKEAEVIDQQMDKIFWKLASPIVWSKGDAYIVAIPSEEYRISYTLDYPQSSYLGSQYYSFLVNKDSFFENIAPCRTFALYEEIVPLIDKGFFKNGLLENGVVIKGDGVLNPEGVRFPNEMVRHKILDMIGDLSLMGVSFFAHIIAIKTGHAANHAFAKQLKNNLQRCV